MTDTGATLKEAGQQQSLFGLKEETWQQFCLVLTTVPAGSLFTCNSIRVLLDWAQIPVGTRGALFHKASRSGYRAPAMHEGYEL